MSKLSSTYSSNLPRELDFDRLNRGLVGVGGFIPSADVKGLVEKGSMNFIFGGNGFFGYFFSESASSAEHRDSPYHVSEPADSLAWWSTYQIEECPDRKTLDMADVSRQLRERHAEWKDPVVQKIIQTLHVESMYPTWTSPPLPTWERDGVVLVGDAAHALPPTSGQGSSQALEDAEAFALLLAHHLRKSASQLDMTPLDNKNAITAAAKQYAALRQPRVTAILKHAQQMQGRKRDMGVIQEYSMYAFMKIMGKHLLWRSPRLD
jgi:2-polyprenyl-6-methoxyphenol hydroxylase-like FAD-dependent oxidoreductase